MDHLAINPAVNFASFNELVTPHFVRLCQAGVNKALFEELLNLRAHLSEGYQLVVPKRVWIHSGVRQLAFKQVDGIIADDVHLFVSLDTTASLFEWLAQRSFGKGPVVLWY